MKTCDLVMKGGITSGIVYPGAVLELSKEFRFANIGGTSAGAIAAALTAAAEYRRQTGGGNAGFDRIAELPRWMGESVDGRSRLLSLFAPWRETRALFETALAFLRSKRAGLFALVRRFPRLALVAALAGVALIVIAARNTHDLAMLFVVAALCIITIIAILGAAAIDALLTAITALPKHNFGLSSGRELAEWLAREIDSIAGTAKPLTFADLEAHGIHLEMMTTNLTHGRPYRLPLESRHFFFDRDEMLKLFPEAVVDFMTSGRAEGGKLHPLRIEELPVVVATRMSLSFPLLLGAVPLWSIDYGRRDDQPREPERCWFSDGGITSNFPVHFFDAPIPRWPTFAINLVRRTTRYHDDTQRIYIPRTNLGGISEWWTPFNDLAGFLKSIVTTMQNWRDNMLLRMPGQRDRVAHVLLARSEGGLNLTMDAATIDDVAQRGAEAGRAFRERFSWRNHKWVRYFSFMAALEEALERWERAFDDETAPPSFRELLERGPLPSYKVSDAERAAMRAASLAFLRHVRQDFAASPFRTPVKRPRRYVVIRAMPRE